jgi:hypothetical protein
MSRPLTGNMRPGVPVVALLAVAALLLGRCAREPGPAEIALEYGRAVYATDAGAIYRLVSADDRRVRDETTFRQQQAAFEGFAGEVLRRLAAYITAAPVVQKVEGRHATVTLRFRLPDANAPAVTSLVHGWDAARLDRLSERERREILDRVTALGSAGKLPMIEGDETLALVKEDAGWRVSLNWAGGVRLRFGAAVRDGLPLRVSVAPAEIVVTPGERVRVTLQARNLSGREITTRVGHRIEPKASADSLALVQCPLFVPVTIKPGQTEEFVSEYLLLKDVASDVKSFTVTYEFP